MIRVYCIDGLCSSVLSRLRLACLDSMAMRDIESTIPSAAVTSWTSAWTGKSPVIHGRFTGTRGKKPRIQTVWDELKDHLDIKVYNEDEWAEPSADIDIYRLDSLPDHLVAGDLGGAQEKLNLLAEYIDRDTGPYVIISSMGVCQHSVVMNLDVFLQAKGLMFLNEHGDIDRKRSRAYCVNYSGAKPRPVWGIYLNRAERDGFLGMDESLAIEAQLIGQINKIDGAEATLSHQRYSIRGKYFLDMPDILVRGNGRLYFRNAGATDHMLVSPDSSYVVGPYGMVAGTEPEMLEGVHRISEVGNAIARYVKGMGK